MSAETRGFLCVCVGGGRGGWWVLQHEDWGSRPLYAACRLPPPTLPALNPTTGMLHAPSVPMMTSGAKATYMRELRRPMKTETRQ